MKCIDVYSLGLFKEPELEQMVHDIRSMGLSYLLEFRKHWNNEIICQFYASYHHERDPISAIDILHWTTEGKHYKVDFITFSHLLGLNEYDHTSPELTEYVDVALEEYQQLYLDGYPTDGQIVYLKPYYVLNNILHQILYPKGGESTYLCDDLQKVLQRFGEDFDKFSISRYIWNKIHSVSEDLVKHYPYAPYLMHVIEQVSGIWFPIDSTHTILKIANKMSDMAVRELKKAAACPRASGSTSGFLSTTYLSHFLCSQ